MKVGSSAASLKTMSPCSPKPKALRIMINRIFLISFLITAQTYGAGRPQGIDRIDALFDGISSTQFQIRLMVLDKDRPWDPPPTNENFLFGATVGFSFASDASYVELRNAIEALQKTSWTRIDSDGYPRWAWQVIDVTSNTVVFSVLLDDERPRANIGGTWYFVEPVVKERLVTDFVQVATKFASRNLGAVDKVVDQGDPGSP